MIGLEKMSQYNKNTTVLFVDDSSTDTLKYLTFLKKNFDKLIVVNNTNEAYEILDTNTINLLITVLYSPNINGLELIQKVQTTPNTISIILFFEAQQNEYLIECLKLNLEAYIQKSFSIEVLEKVIVKLANKYSTEIESKNNQNYVNQYEAILEQSSIIAKTDCDGIIKYVNENFSTISGYSSDELVGKTHGMIRNSDNPEPFYKNIWYRIKEQKKSWGRDH